MQHGSKTLSSFGGSVESSRGVGTCTKPHGSWQLWAHGPLLVGDPDKFLSLVGEHAHFIASPDLLPLGRIHLSAWERLRSHLESVGSPVLAEVERMLGGGPLKWEAAIENLVVNQGLDDVLDKYFKGSAYTASHFVGLTDSTPTPAAGDTMASHAGWSEVTAYTEGARQSLVLGSVSGQSVDNSASKAVFSINATVTVGGAFLCTNSTKGGTGGTLYSVGAFSGGDKSLGSGDSLSVQGTFTQADDGV
jgi:hypothetical protein